MAMTKKEQAAMGPNTDRQAKIEAWMKQREALPKLPPIGSILETYPQNGEALPVLLPTDTISIQTKWDSQNNPHTKESWAVRCFTPDVIEMAPAWYLGDVNVRYGLVCILPGLPAKAFSRIKITGHAKNGKAVFGQPVY